MSATNLSLALTYLASQYFRDKVALLYDVFALRRTTVRQVGLMLTVALADAKTRKVVERITASREHPFYVRGKGFVPAGGLAVGNAIVTRAGPALVVQSIKWNRRPEGYQVYNFVVEDDHSYFVGRSGGGAWAHNPERICPVLNAIIRDGAGFSEVARQ